MINSNEDLKFYKQQRDNIMSEINDLETRIVVAGGRRNRDEVNNYRQRINLLKMRLNEVSQKIFDIENGSNQIQIYDSRGIDSLMKGEINITDNIVLGRGTIEDGVEIIETIDINVKRIVKVQNGKVIYKKETITKNQTRELIKKDEPHFIDTEILN